MYCATFTASPGFGPLLRAALLLASVSRWNATATRGLDTCTCITHRALSRLYDRCSRCMVKDDALRSHKHPALQHRSYPTLHPSAVVTCCAPVIQLCEVCSHVSPLELNVSDWCAW
eukprot:TRINITY_DN8994_c0_g1_i4.p2 TRINITY_DN8994_c0_g1~~TRINITY_DN8994_c0_g1_i4.p2  ORF type:complete len:116 (-),score=0.05 TRINITY_DN8994_c0_g1_i4:520-867(-)